MKRPFYSVVVAAYNPGDRLMPTIKSILDQTFGDFEIIVKDAVSSDGSMEPLKVMAASDARIRIISRKDHGIYDGMNEGIDAAQGQYIYFLNCGDRLHDDSVLQQVHDAAQRFDEANEKDGDAQKPLLLYGDVIEMQTGQYVAAKPNMTPFAMFRNLPSHQACFYDRVFFEDRKFDLIYKVRADYEHFLWCVLQKDADARALGIAVADYEGGGFSESSANREVSAQEHRQITGKYFTKGQLFLFRAYLIVTLQPLREKIAQGKYTAAIYDGLKNRIYRLKGK